MASSEKRLDTESGIPLYLQLKEIIRRRIESGDLEPGAMAPSEAELLEQYQVSRFPIRQAYQQLVEEGYLIRARGKGTFVASEEHRKAARRTPTKKSISFVLDSVAEGILPALAHHIETVAFDVGYSTTVCNTGASPERTLDYIDHISDQDTSGVLLIPLLTDPFEEINGEICRRLKVQGLPFVLVDLYLREMPTHCVCSDNLEGGRLVGRHLRNKGHRRVGVVYDCYNTSCEDRISGLIEGLGENWDTPLVVRFNNRDEGDLVRKLSELLDRKQRPTAIFALHDVIARQILTYLIQRAIAVPEEISLVGYDDLEFSEFLRVPLTTVRQDLQRIGREAVELLIEVIQNPNRELKQVRVPVRLIERASVNEVVTGETGRVVSGPNGERR